MLGSVQTVLEWWTLVVWIFRVDFEFFTFCVSIVMHHFFFPNSKISFRSYSNLKFFWARTQYSLQLKMPSYCCINNRNSSKFNIVYSTVSTFLFNRLNSFAVCHWSLKYSWKILKQRKFSLHHLYTDFDGFAWCYSFPSLVLCFFSWKCWNPFHSLRTQAAALYTHFLLIIDNSKWKKEEAEPYAISNEKKNFQVNMEHSFT